MSLKLLSLALAATATALPQLEPMIKASADNPCEPCQPKGATGTNPPAIGSDLSTLYTNVLNSVKGIEFKQSRSVHPRQSTSGFCCPKSLNCVNVQNVNVAICYDKFTTNFGFADGSYGSLTTGEYKSGAGSANLLSGQYSANGQQGNIYAGNKANDKPNTATLSVPPQYTGTGVGAAIPGNQLGSIIVYTTTIPGETYTAPTTVPGSVQVKTVGNVVLTSTIDPKTISQATTVAPVTSVATVTQSPAAASSTGAAAVVGLRGAGMMGLGAIMAALL